MESQLDPTQPKHALTSQGQVAYYDIGQGPVLLMLHGFPDTPQTFSDLIAPYTQAGLRCVIPYMPGYGLTSMPRRGGGSQLALAEFLQSFIRETLRVDEIMILGHDWGSVTAQMLAGLNLTDERRGYRITRLILAAVPPMPSFLRNLNPRQIYRSRYMYYFQIPGIIQRIRQQDLAYIRTLWARWSPGVPADHPQLQRVLDCLRAPGVLERAISYYRYMLNPLYLPLSLQPLRQARLMFMRKPLPALIIVGTQDDCIGPEMYVGGAQDFPHPNSREVVLPEAGHFLHLEQAAAFIQKTLDFLVPAHT